VRGIAAAGALVRLAVRGEVRARPRAVGVLVVREPLEAPVDRLVRDLHARARAVAVAAGAPADPAVGAAAASKLAGRKADGIRAAVEGARDRRVRIERRAGAVAIAAVAAADPAGVPVAGPILGSRVGASVGTKLDLRVARQRRRLVGL